MTLCVEGEWVDSNGGEVKVFIFRLEGIIQKLYLSKM